MNRLAKNADVSRRHLAELEKGANVSVLLLRAVMSALDIPEVDIGDGKRLRLVIDQNQSALQSVAEDMERAGALILRCAATLRGIVRTAATPAESAPDTPADYRTRASSLIAEFTEMVRNSTSDDQVEQLRQLVHASSAIATTPPRSSGEQGKQRQAKPKTRKGDVS